jgi:glucose-6-phosphate 1-epimerase
MATDASLTTLTNDAISPACRPQTLIGDDGSQLIACAHGGHVLGWTPAGGRPRLWLSPTAECGPGLAIRGGIPVIFPQFAGRGPLPKHGVARNRAWQVVDEPLAGESGAPGELGVTWQARLVADQQTLAIWPHQFELTLTARALGDRLDTTLTARNTGTEPWSFTVALHTYLALGDPAATIHGLGGRTAEDNAAPGSLTTLGAPGGELRATQTRDVAVRDAPEPLRLDDPVLGALSITAEGFADRVVWNPGVGHGLGDVPAGAEQNFVCIEPAALTAIELAPGEAWSGRQTLQNHPR